MHQWKDGQPETICAPPNAAVSHPDLSLQSNLLALFRPMEFSIELHKIKSGWSILYIEGPHVVIL